MNRAFPLGSLPPGVRALLILCGAVFIAQQFASGWMAMNLGLVPSQVINHLKLWQLGTYLFLHGGFFHVLFNLFALWMFGKELEYLWGTKEFIKYYFLCGVGAGILNVVFDPSGVVPVIGASGAIYGLLVAFAVSFPDSVIYLYGIIPMKAKHFMILIGAIEFMASFHGGSTTISRFAHLGGMAVGYFYLKSYEFRSILNRSFQRITDFFVVKRHHRPGARPEIFSAEELTREVDRILEKVLAQGAESLTEREREIMRRYSNRKH